MRQVGGFDENLRVLEDWDLWIRLAHAAKTAACPAVLVASVMHAENKIVAEDYDVTGELDYLAEKYRSLGLVVGTEFDRADTRRWLAGRYRQLALEQRRAGRRDLAAHAYVKSALASRNGVDLLRALGTVLGERMMKHGSRLARLGSRRRSPSEPAATTELAWLDRYR